MKATRQIFLAFLITVTILGGCDKTKMYDLITPPSQASFANQSGGNFYVRNVPNSTFKIPVGFTTVSNVERKITVTISSPTGATSGVQYNVATTTITIPAGKASDSLTVQGLFAGYAGTRKDTLVFTITSADAPVSDYNSTYKLVLQKYCDVDLNTFLGTYTKNFDIQSGSPTYGPYESEMTDAVAISATKGTIKILNFWDVGTSIVAELDYTDPANFKATIPTQFLYTDPTYGAATIKQVGNGSFSSCDNTFTFSYTVTVSAGSFGNFTTTIAR